MKDIKVGDMLIPDDDFISYTGTDKFEVLEVKEFNSKLFLNEIA
jgi:5-formaminoimidazole-4-carboxamide-1-beta-D-ribofuranosyl 5'-monophosphate synthetase